MPVDDSSAAAFFAAWDYTPEFVEFREDPLAWEHHVQWAARRVAPSQRTQVADFVRAQARSQLVAAEVLEALSCPLPKVRLDAIGRALGGDELVRLAEIFVARGDERRARALTLAPLARGEGGPRLCMFVGRFSGRSVVSAFRARLALCEGDDFHAAAELVRVVAPHQRGDLERLASGLRSGWAFMRAAADLQCRRLANGKALGEPWFSRSAIGKEGPQGARVAKEIAACLMRERVGGRGPGKRLKRKTHLAALALKGVDRERIEEQLLAIYGGAMRRDAQRARASPAQRRRMKAVRDPVGGGLELLAQLNTKWARAALEEVASQGPRALRKGAAALL